MNQSDYIDQLIEETAYPLDEISGRPTRYWLHLRSGEVYRLDKHEIHLEAMLNLSKLKGLVMARSDGKVYDSIFSSKGEELDSDKAFKLAYSKGYVRAAFSSNTKRAYFSYSRPIKESQARDLLSDILSNEGIRGTTTYEVVVERGSDDSFYPLNRDSFKLADYFITL